MFDKVCLDNSKIFEAIISGRNAFLIVYEYINLSKKYFSEQFKLEIPLRTSLRPKTIVVDTVDNLILGLKCIVILVIGYSDEINIFVYSELINKLIETHYLEYLPKNPNNNIFVINGPLLVTFSNDVIDFYSFSDKNDRKCLNLPSIISSNIDKVLQVACIGQMLEDNVVLIVFSSKIFNIQEISVIAAKISPDSIANKKILSVSTFFPEFLKPHAKNVHISNLNISNNISELDEIEWKENSTIVCTVTECYICFKGELKYVTVLPLEDIYSIVEELNPNSLKNSSLILKSYNKEVALIKLNKDSNEFQLKRKWTDIESVLVGDILMTGSKQMLLLKSGSFNSWLEDYVLTDISSFVPIDTLDQPTIPNECLIPTISGLSTKLQTGKLAVAHKENEIEDKNKAILDALNTLKNNSNDSSEKEQSSFQDTLINIILHDDENDKMEMDRRRDKQSLKVLKHWKKFFNKKWFLCWTFKNENKSAICYPTLKFIIEDHKVLCRQKTFVHSTSSVFSLEDKSLKEINSQETFSILSCLEFLQFCKETIEVSAVLSWYSASLKEFENELFLPQNEKCLALNQISLSNYLDCSNIFSAENHECTDSFTEDAEETRQSVTEELFCLKLDRQKMVFKVSSKFSNLLSLERMLLTTKLGSELRSIEATSSKILLIRNEMSPLFGVHFQFIILENRNIEIEAFVKNDDDILLLLQFLRHNLPKDVIMIPCGKTVNEISQMKQKIVCAMKEETDFLIASLYAHNISSQIEDYSKIPVQAGSIIIHKNTFLRIRRALIKKEYMTDAILRQISYMYKVF